MKYPLSCDTWGTEEVDAIQKVIKSGRYTMGEEVFAFEKQFAEFMDVKHAKMVNSGSSANLLMIGSAIYNPRYNLKPGDSVIVPAVSWSTTYYPLQQYGLKLIFCDVDLHTLNLDINEVKKAIVEHKPAAILTVNLLGNPSDLTELSNIAEENNNILFEDNCESFGAEINGRKTGTFGTMGTHSFFFSHHLQTMEGGMILTNYEEDAQYIDSMRAHGWLRTLPNENFIHNKTGDPFEDSFRFVLPGYCVRPLEMSGAVGQVQLQKANEMLDQRIINSKIYHHFFDNTDYARTQLPTQNSVHSYFGFSFVLENNLRNRRKDVINLFKEYGIECRPIVAGNFMRNPVIERLCYRTFGTYDNANEIHDQGFFLGNDNRNLEEQLTKVKELMETL